MRWKIVLTTAALAVLAAPSAAIAATTTVWDGNGAENLPCSDGGHWVLSPAQGITAATITVNGVSYVMTQNGLGSFAADSVGTLSLTTVASATYDGDNEVAFLKLSHCTEGETPSPTPPPTTPPPTTPPPTTPPPTTPPPTSTPSSTPSESVTTTPAPSTSSTHTPKPPTSTTTPPKSTSGKPKPSPTAYTGVSDSIRKGLALAGLLLIAGLGLTWYARNKSANL